MDFRKATELYSAEPTKEKLYEVADLLLNEMTIKETENREAVIGVRDGRE